MTVSVANLKEHVETDLASTAIQRLLDAEDEEITRRFGDDATVTEEHILEVPEGFESGVVTAQRIGRRRIWTQQQINSVTTVKEGPTLLAADLTTLVEDADDGFRIIHNGYAIERIGTDFDKRVEIIYVPKTDTKRRDRVTIDLVRLAIQYSALGSEKVGDWSGSHVDYQKERESILRTLNAGRRSYA